MLNSSTVQKIYKMLRIQQIWILSTVSNLSRVKNCSPSRSNSTPQQAHLVQVCSRIYLKRQRVQISNKDKNMRYFPQQVPLCTYWRTRPINRRLYSGIFRDPLDTKYKTFKNKLSHKYYVKSFQYFCKNCKTQPLNGYYMQWPLDGSLKPFVEM